VDPDNRGQIDFLKRKAILKEVIDPKWSESESEATELPEDWQDGRIKLSLIRKALRFRRDNNELFQHSEFVPLKVEGRHAENVVAFLRRTPTSAVLVAVGRWLANCNAPQRRTPGAFDWCDTNVILPHRSPHSWDDILGTTSVAVSAQDGRASLMLKELFHSVPIAFIWGRYQ
jgi:(1->4)-alpha-D-glucan 1-alpha-D-glucosylmutase